MGEEQMKKNLVVLVGGYYPYYGNPMGIVLENLVAPLTSKFDLTILALKRNIEQKNLQPFLHKGAKVITVTSVLHEALLRRNFFARLYCRILSYIKLGRFEDYWIGLMRKRLGTLYKSCPFDGILSLGFPMQLHEAAMKFRDTHPSVKWITYSTDSCYGNSNLVCIKNRLIKRIATAKLARRELSYRKKADFNFVSREIFDFTFEALSPIKNKCDILDYTVSPKSSGLDSTNTSDVTRIVYAGGIPVRMRDPSYFLDVFCSLIGYMNVRFDVYLAGKKPDVLCRAEKKFPNNIFVHSTVGHEEILKVYDQDADVLLNLGNDSDVFSPSKLFDYISVGKPIIDVFYKGRIQNPVVQKYPLVFRMENYGNVKRDAVLLRDFFEKVKNNRLSAAQIREIYREYSPKAAVDRIERVLR